jgi:hypothetical protein
VYTTREQPYKKQTEVNTMKRERKITKKDIKEIAKKYDLDPVDIQDIVNDMESDGIRVTREDIEDMYLNGDLF